MVRTSHELREGFLAYFESKGHLRRPSGSLVPATYDPSVLLTTAGMQPLKPYFLGLEQPPAQRLTTVQKCFRTTDIDSVGLTARHLTFFEMLGNFSVGDYFKDGAIDLAWEFVTEHLGFPVERLWATVFAGDPELGLGEDEVAVNGWMRVGIPAGPDPGAAALGELLAGRARSDRAGPARSSTTTAARSTAAGGRNARRVASATASSSSGTSSSWSSTSTTTGR